jgi:hypothetical protein
MSFIKQVERCATNQPPSPRRGNRIDSGLPARHSHASGWNLWSRSIETGHGQLGRQSTQIGETSLKPKEIDSILGVTVPVDYLIGR